MASSARDPVPTAKPTHTTPPDPPAPAFAPSSSTISIPVDTAAGSATAAPSMADVAAYLENHKAQEPQLVYEADEAGEAPAQTMPKRPRSPSLDSAADGATTADQDLSPRKLARLASGSRFDQGIDPNENGAQSVHDQQPFLLAEAASMGESNSQAAQQALSALRGAEALLSQRTAEHNNTDADVNATTPHGTTDAATAAATAAAVSTLAEAATNQLAAANAANAAAAVAAIAAAAAAKQAQGGSDATTTQSAELMDGNEQEEESHRYADPSATALSMPMVIPELAPRAQGSSTKRHKCPDCDTEFTRHHNLKSHLLTHSQEKPYACRGCDMSFRRLHDLKRHSKLHTGEKPHICPRCNRRFARGDALARHIKGVGGCAGRRSSSGNAVGDQSFEGNSSMVDDSMMSGLEYGEGTADTTERRQSSLPSMKAPPSRSAPAPALGGGLVAENMRLALPALPSPAVAAAAEATAEGPRGPNALGSGSAALYPGRASDAASAALSSLASSTLAASAAMRTAEANVAGGSSILPRQAAADGLKATSPGVMRSSVQKELAQEVVGQQPLVRPTESSSSNGDTNANIFSSEHGMWAYIRTLEDKLKAQADRMQEQDARIAQLETSRHDAETRAETLKQRITALLGQPVTPSPVGEPAPATAADQPPTAAGQKPTTTPVEPSLQEA